MAKGFTRVGTSAQIPKSLVHRVQSLITSQRVGEDVNPKICGVKEIVEQKKQKLIHFVKNYSILSIIM